MLVQGREQVLEVFQSGSFLAVGGQDVDELAAEVVEQSRVRDVLGHEPGVGTTNASNLPLRQ